MGMTINEAILRVINCEYKKDEKEAFKVVKAAGYETIYNKPRRSCDYGWTVRNFETHKEVTHAPYFDFKPVCVRLDKYMTVFGGTGLCKVDFKAFLDKPVNEAKIIAEPLTAREKKWHIKSEEVDIERNEQRIEELKKAIAQMQEDIKKHEELVKAHKKNLTELRKKYGLVKTA